MDSENLLNKSWKPTRPVSKGASAYHEAVCNAEYYIEILDELVKIAVPVIKDNDIVVDFGAGTGVSAMRLMAKLKPKIKLCLVDNSQAWLAKAFEIFESNPDVNCYLLEKKGDTYMTLAETVGRGVIDHVISANTLHLVSDIGSAFDGIHKALKPNGTFLFQSGNITRSTRPEGALMVDDSVKRVHDIALEIVRSDPNFAKYRKDLNEKIKQNESQRKFVFPEPRQIEFYVDSLAKAGFKHGETHFKLFKVKYSDWLDFLRVKRLQAGILPEIGGYEPSPKEEKDRDTLITLATNRLFEDLKKNNSLADEEGFTIEVVYVSSRKTEKLDYYKQKLGLNGKIALVTGASRGIGRAIAIELARNGAKVIVNYNKNEIEAKSVLSEVKKLSDGILLQADVSDFEAAKSMAMKIKESFSKIDILVNNAGIITDKTMQNMSFEEWRKVIHTNLDSVFNVTKNILPLINENGRIINISSIVALDGNFGQCNYAASKAGIIGFTKSLAKEVSRKKITVNAVAPGLIETDILKPIPANVRKEFNTKIPIGRSGVPEDVANLVVFLSSEMAGYITAEVIPINGGLHF